LAVVGTVLLVVSLFNFRAGRRAPYWRLRRNASVQGWRLFGVSLTLLFVAAAVFLFSGLANLILEPTATPAVDGDLPTNTPYIVTATALPGEEGATSSDDTLTPDAQTPAAMPTPTDDVPPTSTGAPLATTEAPAATDTPVRTSSPTRTLTEPPASPTPDAPGVTPLAASVTPLPEAALQIIALDSETDSALNPLNPRDTFAAGIQRIYFWLEYRGMTDGVAWERVLLRDGEVVQGGAYLWSGGADGASAYFFGDAEGFPAGAYAIQVTLQGDVAAAAEFVIE
ncbi:MAG: hypothetical protein JW910_15600, partial [Anaerolineae bacterium]|nr:hypothetical protein [Anaerolineae bacterium]